MFAYPNFRAVRQMLSLYILIARFDNVRQIYSFHFADFI